MSNIISIKSFLTRKEDDAEFLRVVTLLLEGIALHAVEGDKTNHEVFRTNIRDVQKRAGEASSASVLFALASEATRLLGEHNRQASAFIQKQGVELQHMVGMLTRTVMAIGDSSQQSQTRLQEIEGQISSARQIENIHLLKSQLGQCLETVRHETLRQKTESTETLQSLRRQLDTAPAPGQGEAPLERDPITGLPNSAEAENAIRASLSSPDNKYLAVAAVGRIQAINARFGYAVGDQVLNAFKGSFEKTMDARDRLFRWRGPALVALLEREQPIEQVRTEIRRFSETKLEKTVEVGTRSIMMPISATWAVMSITPPADGLMKKIEAFLTAQVPREYC